MFLKLTILLLVGGTWAQQYANQYVASNTPSHTTTLGQAYQQQPSIRSYASPQVYSAAAPSAASAQSAQAGRSFFQLASIRLAPQQAAAGAGQYGGQLTAAAAPSVAQHASAAPVAAAPQVAQTLAPQYSQTIPRVYTTLVQRGASPQHALAAQQAIAQQQAYAPQQAIAAQQQQYAAPQQYTQQLSPVSLAHAQAAAAGPSPAAAAQIAPMSYGWQVQHQHQQPQPQAQPTLAQAAPAQAQAQAQQLLAAQQQQYLAAQRQQLAQAQAAQAAQVQASPAQVSALHRPAAVHYASLGENLSDYKFGYRTGDGNSFREESRLPDGTVQGQYGFVDADGKQRVVKYTAGVGGFQVLNGDGASPASQATPIARSAHVAQATPVAVPQWAQGHLSASIPQAPQAQAQTIPGLSAQYAAAQSPQYAAASAAQSQQPQVFGTHLG